MWISVDKTPTFKHKPQIQQTSINLAFKDLQGVLHNLTSPTTTATVNMY